MGLDEAFITYVVERLKPLGTISAKRVFGCCGIFCDGKMFCKISPSQTVSLKADEEAARIYAEAGMRKSGKMNYYELSAEQMENDEVLLEFGRMAQRASSRTSYAATPPVSQPRARAYETPQASPVSIHSVRR